MQAKDIMTRRVITVGAETSVQEIAQTLLQRSISAVPVVDAAGAVIGIVSEGDLIRRREVGTDEVRHSWWLGLLNDRATLAKDFLKTHGKAAKDVMTKDVVSVSLETPLAEIARLMEKNHIKRVPVVDGGKLVGLISRANIVRQIASAKELHVESYIDDTALKREVQEILDQEPWASPGTSSVTVSEGVVEFWGTVNSDEERQASRVAVQELAGVKEVVDHRQVRPVVLVSGL